MSGEKPEMAKVLFRVESDDGTCQVETLWACRLGNDQYRLDNSPFYAYSVSWNDIVLAPHSQDEGLPTYTRTVRKSGHRTVRIMFDEPAEPGSESDLVLQDLIALGCTYEGAYGTLISVDVPPNAKLDDVRDYLVRRGVTWEHADPTYEEIFGGG